MSHDALEESWSETLIRLGGSIHQDDADPLSDEDEAVEQAGIEQYQAMLDAVTGQEGQETLEAILWSLHPIDDYGIYEAAYSAVSLFDAAVLGETAARVLPEWVARNGDHPSIQTAIMPVAYREDVGAAFLGAAASWPDDARVEVVRVVESWIRESEDWEPLLRGLGGTVPAVEVDPIPADWPDDWRDAAEGFRDSGRVDLAWTDERTLENNFDRVFALLEVSHGSRWRELGDFLNILFIRRRKELPVFARALAELPASRREVIVEALERSRPGIAVALRESGENVT